MAERRARRHAESSNHVVMWRLQQRVSEHDDPGLQFRPSSGGWQTAEVWHRERGPAITRALVQAAGLTNWVSSLWSSSRTACRRM